MMYNRNTTDEQNARKKEFTKFNDAGREAKEKGRCEIRRNSKRKGTHTKASHSSERQADTTITYWNLNKQTCKGHEITK